MGDDDMTIRSPSRSVFRPRQPIDQSVLEENRKLIQEIDRRKILRGAVSLGALTMLTGCTVTDRSAVQAILRAVSEWNDGVQGLLFKLNRLAPTFTEAEVARPPRFNAHFGIQYSPKVDGSSWALELHGRIDDKRPWSLQRIAELPEQELIIRHICVEGWDYIGQWSGPSLRLFLERVGADLSAKYLMFRCVGDDYTSSIDMATALHPQTILATKYAREPLDVPFGFPLRLRTATKLGYKNAKWIQSIEVTNTYPSDYWTDMGFNWHAGL